VVKDDGVDSRYKQSIQQIPMCNNGLDYLVCMMQCLWWSHNLVMAQLVKFGAYKPELLATAHDTSISHLQLILFVLDIQSVYTRTNLKITHVPTTYWQISGACVAGLVCGLSTKPQEIILIWSYQAKWSRQGWQQWLTIYNKVLFSRCTKFRLVKLLSTVCSQLSDNTTVQSTYTITFHFNLKNMGKITKFKDHLACHQKVDKIW